MFTEYMGRRRALLLVEDWRFGVLASLISNQWRGKDSPVSQPWDWFPSLVVLRPKVATDTKKSPAQLFQMAKAVTLALGGRVLKDSYPG
jgi:hypothetical protein